MKVRAGRATVQNYLLKNTKFVSMHRGVQRCLDLAHDLNLDNIKVCSAVIHMLVGVVRNEARGHLNLIAGALLALIDDFNLVVLVRPDALREGQGASRNGDKSTVAFGLKGRLTTARATVGEAGQGRFGRATRNDLASRRLVFVFEDDRAP